jgi:hypothetical protein
MYFPLYNFSFFTFKNNIRFDKENLHIALGFDACGSSDVGTEGERGGKD